MREQVVNNNIEAILSIDFAFVEQMEVLNDEVKGKPSVSNNSGVAVSRHLSLGNCNPATLRSMGINPTLIGKLYPYLGLKGLQAREYFNRFPLNLSESEYRALDSRVKQQLIWNLIAKFDESSNVPFSDIKPCWQTIIASIALQFEDLKQHCGAFWQSIVEQQWGGALVALESFDVNDVFHKDFAVKYLSAHS